MNVRTVETTKTDQGNRGAQKPPSRLPLSFGNTVANGFTVDHIKGPEKQIPRSQIALEDCLRITINLTGKGKLKDRARVDAFDSNSFWLYWQGKHAAEVLRQEGHYEFISVLIEKTFLQKSLPSLGPQTHPVLSNLGESKQPMAGESTVELLDPALETWVRTMLNPPALKAAQNVYYQAKVLELISLVLFQSRSDELFCHKQHRLATIRTTKAKRILDQHLASPPRLKELGRLVGCSPYHLSRTFSEEAGMTIPQYIRQQRMEKAAKLLKEGRLNVTEVALEVGYSSTSHFSQAFCQTIGTCPTMYAI